MIMSDVPCVLSFPNHDAFAPEIARVAKTNNWERMMMMEEREVSGPFKRGAWGLNKWIFGGVTYIAS